MKIDEIRARVLTIPFKAAFRHASADRGAMQSVWVEARGAGVRGYGEGCPREYVTGETLPGALRICEALSTQLAEQIVDIHTLQAWAARHEELLDSNPAAWCALELALLDLIASAEGVSVERLLHLPEVEGRFRYTAVLGDAAPAAFEAQLARYVEAGFDDFKVKLSGDPERDLSKVASLRALDIAPEAVRADANNLWGSSSEAVEALEKLRYRFHAIEEPLAPGDISGMAEVSDATGAKIVLDESLARAEQIETLPGATERWIVNLRVSKMGGILRSLRTVAAARERGLKLIVGAHVGETSVLTRAALTVAAAARDALMAQEGAVGTHLIVHDVVTPPLMFGAGGVLDTRTYHWKETGWGITIDTAALAGASR